MSSDAVKLLLTLVIGYLLGSISTGVILSRAFGHKDIRSQGSGNSGTTNMLRVMGKKFALLTFAGDLLKGIVVSALTFLLYKRISPILHKNDAKRAARLEKKNTPQSTPKEA